MSALSASPTGRIERRLLATAGGFLGIYSLALTLANATRMRSWQVEYRWVHWLGLAVWAGLVWLVHRQLERRLPERDPYLFPLTALLTGWGLLSIWRLSTSLGLRQTAWLVLIGAVLTICIQKYAGPSGEKLLGYLRRYKYIWLTGGLLLTAATLFLGTNPQGLGPRLWLGCCGIYFQPSEPLKLLLVVYLAAYLSDRLASASPPRRVLSMLAPTLILTGLAMLLLVFQRDLGTAAIFLALYAVIVFAGTGDYRVLIFSFLVLIAAGAVGYSLFDVVSQRIDAWVNPWLDPAGRSYQIVQSLLAVANGGLLGRGPGMGSPSLVPIAQSDFIFASISEESGLLGALALFGLLALLMNRGMRLALHSKDNFLRLLATGLVAHLVGQSILIIGGNLRLLPLTGVTLPFVSYGGSSLLVSWFELLVLLLISSRQEELKVLQPDRLKAHTRISLLLSAGMLLGLAVSAFGSGWWGLVRGPMLLTRTDNPRRAINDRYVRRGSILDDHDQPLAESTGQPGNILRQYPYPSLGPLIGYTDPIYGQAGLEAALDPYLRGLQGYPTLSSWWEHLLYGSPPPGLDVRLSLARDLQAQADALLAGKPGAIVLMNARTGEIKVMASSPAFDANNLDVTWESLINDPGAPLYNRATMGLYPPGALLGAFLLPGSQQSLASTTLLADPGDCTIIPSGSSLGAAIRAGC
ncbi:MAG: FtsW/RodA/SpoVE family cell cycle protein, partial [Acidobacteriaceae bacterium]